MSDDIKKMTIKNVIQEVENNEWVLPTFQRKYVWSQEQICDLFDSIMRSYPIGTFMVWKVERSTASNSTFYKFITDYQEFWRELGESFTPNIKDYYYAVIDGQQRINSLYIGLCGSYAAKLPRKHWRNSYDESIQPKTYLYMNLFEDATEDNSRVYDFRFFSDEEIINLNTTQWFRVKNALNIPFFQYDEIEEKMEEYVETENLLGECDDIQRKEALKKLCRLYRKIFHTNIINYYEEQEQNLERVVDVFLRTNGGGTPLEFSDLVMSVMLRDWEKAKDKIEELIKLVFTETGIIINKDFILKVFLMLYSKDISFKVWNFENPENNLIEEARNNFDTISKLILGACRFANQKCLNNETLRSKYALIPLIYYSYKHPNFVIDNVVKDKAIKRQMEIWLKSALLKSMFGGKPDSVLVSIRKVLDNSKSKTGFPAKEIVEHFKNEPKDISIDREFLEDRIRTSQYGSAESYLLLSLAINLDPKQKYSMDHMYPKDMFKKKTMNQYPFLKNNQNLRDFYENNWNSVGNLQLLTPSENSSKNDTKLSVWTLNNKNIKLSDYCVPQDSNGDYIVGDDKFKEFMEGRRTMLIDKIMNSLTL